MILQLLGTTLLTAVNVANKPILNTPKKTTNTQQITLNTNIDNINTYDYGQTYRNYSYQINQTTAYNTISGMSVGYMQKAEISDTEYLPMQSAWNLSIYKIEPMPNVANYFQINNWQAIAGQTISRSYLKTGTEFTTKTTKYILSDSSLSQYATYTYWNNYTTASQLEEQKTELIANIQYQSKTTFIRGSTTYMTKGNAVSSLLFPEDQLTYNTTTYIVMLTEINWQYNSTTVTNLPNPTTPYTMFSSVSLNATWTTTEFTAVNYEVVDIGGLMFQILTMPFSFISIAFNLTLFPGTPYQINISLLFLVLIAILVFALLMKVILGFIGGK